MKLSGSSVSLNQSALGRESVADLIVSSAQCERSKPLLLHQSSTICSAGPGLLYEDCTMAEAEMEAELLAFNFSDSEAEVGETAREARIRQAVEQSKTYVAHRDVPYWFARPPDKQVEQMCSLRRAGPEVEWAIASLYARGMYSAAYALAVQALRMQNLVYSAPAGCRTEVLRTPSRKPNMPRLASKVNTREALDTALRSACRMVRAGAPPPEEDCIALLLLAKDEAMGWFPAQEWERAVPPDYFPPPTQQDHVCSLWFFAF